MAQGELFFQRAVGWHAVVHPPGQIADFRVKRAAKRHVHLLKATADAHERLAPVHASADQGQRDRIAAPVKTAMRGGFILAILAGMHVRASPGQKKAVTQIKQISHADQSRIGRDDQGQGARNLGHRDRVHRATRMHRIAVVDHVAVANDPHDRSPPRTPRAFPNRHLACPLCGHDTRKARRRNGQMPVQRAQTGFDPAHSPFLMRSACHVQENVTILPVGEPCNSDVLPQKD